MIALICAMEPEAALLKAALTESRQEAWHRWVFQVGRLDGHEVVLLQCGIGKVNAAAGAALVLSRYPVTALVQTGAAGAVDPRLEPGDLVIGTELFHHDADVTAFGYALGQLPGEPARFRADPQLQDQAAAAFEALKAEGALQGAPKVLRGPIASGDQFVNSRERVQDLRRLWPDLAALEMEGAALAQVCAAAGTPFMILRAVSDKADGSSHLDFQDFLQLASRNSALLTRRLLALIEP